METPIPNKKILKRKLKGLSAKNKLSQKKLKTAINVSLNTSHTVRSLRLNNHSLALKVETLKKESRVNADVCQSLLEVNHNLRQKNVTLECIINDPDSYIEDQIRRKVEIHLKTVRTVIQQMQNDVLGFSMKLKALDEMCSSLNIPPVEENEGSQTPYVDFPMPTPLRYQIDATNDVDCISAAVDDEFILTSGELESKEHDTSGESTEQPLCTESESQMQQNMSIVFEKNSTEDTTTMMACSDSDSESSKLPVRIASRSKESKRSATDQDDTYAVNKRPSRSRRRTRVLLEDEVNVLGILDVEPPPNLLSSPLLPSSSGDYGDQIRVNDMPSDIVNALPEGEVSSSNKKDTKDMHLKKSSSKLQTKIDTTKKQPVSSHQKNNSGLFIANEFILNNMHQKRTEKLNALASEKAVTDDSTKIDSDEDHTVHIVEDMDLTLPVNGPLISVIHYLNPKEDIQVDADPSVLLSADEVCPEAVTLQRMKPGQLKFSASRKEVDGSRKSLSTQPPKARSRSKKVIAEMIDKLPQEEAKSIFDFHDKTPTFSKNDKDMSVFNLQDDSSVIFPTTPLGRKKDEMLLPEEETKARNRLLNEKECAALPKFDNDILYSLPLKDDTNKEGKAAVGNSRSRSRSRVSRGRSRSRVRCDVDNEGHSEEGTVKRKDPSLHPEVTSMLGEGKTFNIFVKDNSELIEKVTVRKDRGRSRSRAKSSLDKQQAFEGIDSLNNDQDQQSSWQLGKQSALGEGTTYVVPLKNESENASPRVRVKGSRSQSRGRALRARSRSRAWSSPNDKISTSMPVEGSAYSVVTDGSDCGEKGTMIRSRGKSQSRAKSAIDEQQFSDHLERLDTNSDEQSGKQSVKQSALGEGTTYTVPLNDKSDNDNTSIKVRSSRSQSGGRASRARSQSRGRTSRARSRGRDNSTPNDKILDSEMVVSVKDQNTISIIGDTLSSAKVVPPKSYFDEDKKITVQSSRSRSLGKAKSSTKDQLSICSEILDNGKETDFTHEKMSEERLNHRSPIKDNSQVTGVKSRGRPRKRNNSCNVIPFNQAKSCPSFDDPGSDEPFQKEGGKNKIVNGSYMKPETLKLSEVSGEVDRQDNSSSTPRKRGRPKINAKSGHAEVANGGNSNSDLDRNIHDDSNNIESQSPKHRRSPPTSHRKLVKSKRKKKICDVQTPKDNCMSTNRKKKQDSGINPSSSLPVQIREIKTKQVVHETCSKSVQGTRSPQLKAQAGLNEIEINGDGLDAQSESNSPPHHKEKAKRSLDAELSDFKLLESSKRKHKKRRELNNDFGNTVCRNSEDFDKQISILKKMYTPECFKKRDSAGSACSPSATPEQSASVPIGSVSHSLVQRSASKKGKNFECETLGDSRRRRAASKSVSYREPSLGGKLRRGDPFTSIGQSQLSVFKSPKGFKKSKVKREALSPLQNYTVEEETS